MFRKALVPLFMLIGIVLLASCSPKQASPTPEANMANPASVYCEKKGGSLELRQDASGGVAGTCIFPDGSECDEWAYYRGECQPGNSSATPEPNMANPASVHCEQNGGSLELRQDASGAVAGICIFPDGSECDEWAYYRGECQPGDSLATPEPAAAPAAALRIVYFKDGQVMLWTDGLGSRPLAEASTEQLRISEDGQVVAYLGTNSAGVTGLFSVNADGTNAHLLVPQDYLQTTQPASQIVSFDFAPASHTLYFVTDQYDLTRVDAESGGPAPVFGAGKGGFFSFSPDGQWMVLYHPNELVLAHPDGSAARQAFQYPPDFSYSMMGPEIAWKADSSGFSLVSASGPQGEADSMTVWFVPEAGQAVKQMSYAGPYGANLSPDGSTVVYLYFQHEPVDVHIVGPDGKDTTCGSYSSITYPAINFLGWAPDSKSFLLNLSNDGRLMDPWLCAAGKQPFKLTDTNYANPVVWVDKARFLFISDGSLRLQKPGEPSIALDTVSSSNFDFTILEP